MHHDERSFIFQLGLISSESSPILRSRSLALQKAIRIQRTLPAHWGMRARRLNKYGVGLANPIGFDIEEIAFLERRCGEIESVLNLT